MIEALDFGEDVTDLGTREHHGKFELGIGANQTHLVGPFPLKSLLPEELEGADKLSGGLAGDLLNALEVDAVLAHLLGGDQLGRTVVVLAELADASVVGLFGAGTDRQKLEVIGESF